MSGLQRTDAVKRHRKGCRSSYRSHHQQSPELQQAPPAASQPYQHTPFVLRIPAKQHTYERKGTSINIFLTEIPIVSV